MLLFIHFFASLLSLASATPSQTIFTNSTRVSPAGPAVSGQCRSNCTWYHIDLSHISWSQMSITATITAETVLLVVNRKKNSTRTTTIKNTEIDFDKIVKPSTINSAGTVTTVVDILDGSTWSTQVVAYPTTAYHDYPANYTWSGTLSTTISGVQTCATETADQVFPWPSHPLLPKKIQTELDLDEDPRGWTYIAHNEGFCGDPDKLLPSLFPDLGLWSCQVHPYSCVAPVQALQTALYLTKTSTSTEPDEPEPTGAVSTQTPAVKTPTSLPRPVAVQLPTTSPTTSLSFPSPAEPDSNIVAPVPSPPAEQDSNIVTPVPSPPAEQDSNIVTPVPSPPAEQDSNIVTPVPSPPAEQDSNIVTPVPSPPAEQDSNIVTPVPSPPAEQDPNIVTPVDPASASVVVGSPVDSTPSVVAAPTDFLVSSTNVLEGVVPSNSQLPALLLTFISAQGSQVVKSSLPDTFPLTTPYNVPIVVDSQTFTPNAQLQYLVSGQTLAPGSSIELGSGSSNQVLALQTSNGEMALVHGSSTSILFPIATTPTPYIVPIVVDSQTFTPNAQLQYLVSGQTLAPGSSINLGSGSSNQVLALQTSNGEVALVYGPSTSILSPTATTPPPFIIGSQTITANLQSQYIVSGETLTPGSTVILGSGSSTTALALQTSNGNTALVYGTSTSNLFPAATVAPPVTVDGQTVTANAKSQYIISGQTLAPGSSITLGTGSSTTVLALQTSGGSVALVFGPSTSVLSPDPAGPPAIIIGTQTIKAISQTQYIIGSQTLTPGGVVTADGTTISLAASGTEVVVGTSTEGLGGYITAGFGGGANGTVGVGFAGVADRRRVSLWVEAVSLVVMLGVVMML